MGLVDVTKTVQEVVSELRKDSQSISLASGRTHTAVGLARKALHGAFLAHRTACRSAARQATALPFSRTAGLGNGWEMHMLLHMPYLLRPALPCHFTSAGNMGMMRGVNPSNRLAWVST